jgi:hypothetical protein
MNHATKSSSGGRPAACRKACSWLRHTAARAPAFKRRRRPAPNCWRIEVKRGEASVWCTFSLALGIALGACWPPTGEPHPPHIRRVRVGSLMLLAPSSVGHRQPAKVAEELTDRQADLRPPLRHQRGADLLSAAYYRAHDRHRLSRELRSDWFAGRVSQAKHHSHRNIRLNITPYRRDFTYWSTRTWGYLSLRNRVNTH